MSLQGNQLRLSGSLAEEEKGIKREERKWGGRGATSLARENTRRERLEWPNVCSCVHVWWGWWVWGGGIARCSPFLSSSPVYSSLYGIYTHLPFSFLSHSLKFSFLRFRKLSSNDHEAKVDHEKGSNYNEKNKVQPVPKGMCVLNVVHYFSPSFKWDHDKDGCPGHSDVVKTDGPLKRILRTCKKETQTKQRANKGKLKRGKSVKSCHVTSLPLSSSCFSCQMQSKYNSRSHLAHYKGH